MKMLSVLLPLVIFLMGSVSTSMAGPIVESAVEYRDGSQAYEGFLVKPKGISKSKSVPGILVVHNWFGLSEETKNKARELAKLGYVAFAADIYGKGTRPKTVEEAAKLATQFKTDRKTYRERLNLALQVLSQQSGVDSKRLAATGYCFGGTGVIELARSGAAVKGVVSFHGGLDSPEPSLGKNIVAQVIAFHGADDPYVPAKDLAAFEDEMRANKVDWQLVKFGNAVHSFTDHSAGHDNSKGAAYNEAADRRSWSMMKEFFKGIF